MYHRRPLNFWIFLGILHLFVLTSSYAALIFEKQELQQTANAEEKRTSAIFRFKNSGHKTVIITSVLPSCGCTTAKLGKEIYLPDESGQIEVIFNFEDRVGPQDKTVQITTDDELHQLMTLSLHVDILEPLKYSSRLLFWKVGEAADEKELLITPTGERKIASISVQSTPNTNMISRIDPQSDGYRLIVHPVSSKQTAQVSIVCVAKFADGTTYPFTVFAVVR